MKKNTDVKKISLFSTGSINESSEINLPENVIRLKRSKRFYNYKSTILNFKSFLIKTTLQNFSIKIVIRIRSNNIFCTLLDLAAKKTLFNISSGKYNLNTSKKKLKYNIRIILNSFFKDSYPYLKQNNNFIVELVAPFKNRKQALNLIQENIKQKNIILQIKENKCFNGCRPSKKRRKKRLKFRLFK